MDCTLLAAAWRSQSQNRSDFQQGRDPPDQMHPTDRIGE
jgi:hypothetical protein